MATAPQVVAPADNTQNPALRNAIGTVTQIAQQVKALAQAYPQCADEGRQIADLLQRCLMKVTQSQQPAEPAAPPV